MKRRTVLASVSVAGLSVTSGCLSGARASLECSPQSQWGIFFINNEPERVELEVAITRWDREVFSDTITLPAAAQERGPTGTTETHPEYEYEPDVVTNIRQYTVSITHEGETFETPFRPTCEHLDIRYSSGHASVGSVPPDRAQRWRKAADE